METDKKEELVRAFHMMWDNYPEVVRLIDRRFNIIAGNPAFYQIGGQDGVKCNTGDPALHEGCQAMNALKTQETKTKSSEVEGVAWETYWIPVAGESDYYVHFTNGFRAYAAKKMAEAAAEQNTAESK